MSANFADERDRLSDRDGSGTKMENELGGKSQRCAIRKKSMAIVA